MHNSLAEVDSRQRTAPARVSGVRESATGANGTAPKAIRLLLLLGVTVLPAGPKLLFGGSGTGTPPAAAAPSAADLGIEFVENSSSALVVERNGKRYLVDLATHAIHEAGSHEGAPAAGTGLAESERAQGQPDAAAIFQRNCSQCHGPDGRGTSGLKTPDFTSQAVQAALTDQKIEDTIRHGIKDTLMPAWQGKLSDADIQAVRGFLRSLANRGPANAGPAAEASKRRVYTPGDDLVFSLPTGRPVPRHGLVVNFTHRFPYTPAFTGRAEGGSLLGLDDFAIPSFGFAYGVTDKLSLSIYRSPTQMARPIQLMAAYNFLDERKGQPINAAVRLSIQGQDSFARNFTENLEGVFSRSLGGRAQLYAVPTLSLNNRVLFQPASFLSSAIPNLPGYNTFSLGAGAAVDIRPTVAVVAEVIPTLVNGRPLEIHRPAYSFGIQKKIWRHSFTFGFTTSPGTTVAQRAATRASFLGNPTADKPGGLFVGFDLSRQLH